MKGTETEAELSLNLEYYHYILYIKIKACHHCKRQQEYSSGYTYKSTYNI